MPKTNWDNVMADGEPLPEGDYAVIVKDVEETVSKKGNDMWVVTLAVAGGPFKGLEVKDFFVFGTRAEGRIKSAYKHMGMPVEGVHDCQPEEIQGKTVGVELFHHEWEKRRYAKVRAYKPLEEVGAPKQAPAAAGDDDQVIPF